MINLKNSPRKQKKEQRDGEKKRKLDDQARISNTPLLGVPERENRGNEKEETIQELIQEYFQVLKGHAILY